MKQKTTLIALSCLLLAGTLSADETVFSNSDFEQGDLSGWTASGTAFSRQPTQGDNTAARKRESAGPQGQFWIGTFENNPKGANTPGKTQGDKPTGTLVSQDFPVKGKYLTFLVGAGRNEAELYVNVMVDGKSVARRTGVDSETMVPVTVDMRPYQGKTARIEIVDNAAGRWGHINVDNFRWSDDDNKVVLSRAEGPSFTVDKKYLLIPVANPEKEIARAAYERIVFLENGKPVQTLNAFLPEKESDIAWWAAYPMGQYAGKQLTIAAENLPQTKRAMFQKIALSDTAPTAADDYKEVYRNQFHYSPVRGWNNDINGLYYRDGVWHMFYQYNPLGIYWQNMHWEHATSKDLVHWTPQGIKVFQNGIGDMAYSGTAFVDKNNTLGLAPSGKGADVIAYTSTGRGECLTYSLDDGKTWKEIAENPVVKHRGRDPKVFWHAPTQKWVMIVYDEQAHPLEPAGQKPFRRKNLETRDYKGFNFAIYTSANLRDWEVASRFTMPDRSTVYECPELIELPVDGNPANTQWVVWGVMQYYHIGDFDGKTFTPLYPYSLTGVDERCRAAITFDNAPDNRTVLIGWTGDSWPAMRKRFPELRFSQGMTLPMELSLKTTPDGIRLFTYPVKEINALRGAPIVDLKNPTFAQAKAAIEALNGPETKWLDIVMEYKQGPDGKLTLRADGTLQANTHGDFLQEKDKQPFTPAAHGELRVLVDTAIIDCYLDQGRRTSVKRRPVDKIGTTELQLEKQGDLEITSLKIYPMQSIWKK